MSTNTLATSLSEPPPPFSYKATVLDEAPGPKFAMTPDNLAPALVVWLFLTTNPEWLPAIGAGGAIPDAINPTAALTAKDIGDQLGLSAGTVAFILGLINYGEDTDPAVIQAKKDLYDALAKVGSAFQSIKDCYDGADAYRPPCPPHGGYILNLAPSAWVKDPGV